MEANKAVNQPSSWSQDSRTFSRNVEIPRSFSTRITISFTYLFSFFFRYCDQSFNSLHFSLIRRIFSLRCRFWYGRPCLNSANCGPRYVTSHTKFRESALLRMKFPRKAVSRMIIINITSFSLRIHYTDLSFRKLETDNHFVGIHIHAFNSYCLMLLHYNNRYYKILNDLLLTILHWTKLLQLVNNNSLRVNRIKELWRGRRAPYCIFGGQGLMASLTSK